MAARCIAAGAAVINDTTGLHDPELADVVAEQGTVVITHSLRCRGSITRSTATS